MNLQADEENCLQTSEIIIDLPRIKDKKIIFYKIYT